MLVFDNYQDAGVQSPLNDAVLVGLEEVPKGGCVIITSRLDAPASTARLRASQACGGSTRNSSD